MEKPTIGMAVYDDYRGLWATLTALELFHADEFGDLVVIENGPGEAAGRVLESWPRHMQMDPLHAAQLQALRDDFNQTHSLLASITQNRKRKQYHVTFEAFGGPGVGTAAPRERVFDYAPPDRPCIVIDSHVQLWPGAIRAVADYFADGRNVQALVHGPLMNECHSTASTFMEAQWNGSAASGGFGRWHTVPVRAIKPTPVEIPLHGLGAFAMMPEHFPGFDVSRFGGFGGIEGPFHDKVRAQGGAVVCVPGFRWSHLFGQPRHVRYPYDGKATRVCNYLTGWAKLGNRERVRETLEFYAGQLSRPEIASTIAELALTVPEC